MARVILRTEVPGPNSKALQARREAAVPRGVSQVTPIFSRETRGATITDVDGNVLLDFAGGIGVLNVGANDPGVLRAIGEQVERALHTCAHVTMNEPYLELAEALNRITPGNFAKRTLLLTTGAEAVENAIKIARRHTGRQAVIGFSRAFHGRTMMGMSLTGKVSTYKYGFGPFAPEVYRLPSVDLYHSPFHGEEETVTWTLEQIRRAIEDEIGRDKVAAMIIEPVQGEGGFLVQPAAFLRGLREIADAYGIVLIIDEIQTGFARCGAMFACERSEVTPDLILTAKSLGGGLPIAAVTGRAEIMDAAQVGGLGGTFGGNPVSCSAALEVIRILEEGQLSERANALGERVKARLRALAERSDLIGDVRGLGAMVAVEFVQDRLTKTPATEATGAIRQLAYARGLVLMPAGDHNNVIRFLAPLVISDEELEEGLDILEAAVLEVSESLVRS